VRPDRRKRIIRKRTNVVVVELANKTGDVGRSVVSNELSTNEASETSENDYHVKRMLRPPGARGRIIRALALGVRTRPPFTYRVSCNQRSSRSSRSRTEAKRTSRRAAPSLYVLGQVLIFQHPLLLTIGVCFTTGIITVLRFSLRR